MSGLAAILHKNGYTVQGSDIHPGSNLAELRKEGVRIFSSQTGTDLNGVGVFVKSLAIKEDNEEYIQAQQMGLPIIQRHELLGEILNNFEYSVAVSGTHGKTTTSSMIGYILRLSKLDPSLHIGSDLFFQKHGTYYSGSDYFVLEACEYGNSFHSFKPYIGVVLNIEADHLDFFKDIMDIRAGFAGFASGIKENGYLVYHSGDASAKDIAISSQKRSVSFGFSESDDYMAGNISFKDTLTYFDIYRSGKLWGNFQISVPGIHNVLNALCAAAVCDLLQVDTHFVKNGLRSFRGAARRLELLFRTEDGVSIYDDYAHHPTEIKASLKALSEIKKGRLICIFQPHTYTRTKALFDDFTKAFSGCDMLILTPIYAAREKNDNAVSSEDLCKKIPQAVYIENLEAARQYVLDVIEPGDLVVSMGAGDIFKVTYPLARRKVPE